MCEECSTCKEWDEEYEMADEGWCDYNDEETYFDDWCSCYIAR